MIGGCEMSTPHPSEQEQAAIQRHADAGDKSASEYLELLDACTLVLEASNGISLARGMLGEHNDVYGHAIDSALAQLVPVIYKIAAGGWQGLKWYVPREKRKSRGTKNPQEMLDSAERKVAEAQRQADEQRKRMQKEQP